MEEGIAGAFPLPASSQMNAQFDPYYTWLGIPPDEQPANLYRLLGLRLFENNLDAIEHAADRQMAHLRSVSTGANQAYAQKLLNEVAAARVRLLDADAKSRYDAGLRGAMSPPHVRSPEVRGTTEPTPSRPIPVAPAAPYFTANIALDSSGRSAAVRIRRRPSATVVFAATSMVVGAILLVVFVIRGQHTAPVTDNNHEKRKNVEKVDPATTARRPREKSPPARQSPAPGAVAVTPQKVDIPEVRTPEPQAPANPLRAPEPEFTASERVAHDDNPNLPDHADNDTGRSLADLVEQKPSVTETRLPLPAEEVYLQRKAEIENVFATEFAKKSANEVWSLGRRMLALASESRGDAVERYTLLSLATELAVTIGDTETARLATDAIAADFAIDPLTKTVDAVTAAARSKSMPASARGRAIFDLDEIAKRAIAKDRFELATGILQTHLGLARAERDGELAAWSRRLTDHVKLANERWPVVRDALATLKTAPDDTNANETVGRFYCLFMGNWKRGMPYLAKGGDSAIQIAAKVDQDATRDISQLVPAANRWFEVAPTLNGVERDNVLIRAGVRYRQALPSAVGIDKVTAERRLMEIMEACSDVPSRWELYELHGTISVGDFVRISRSESESRIVMPLTFDGGIDVTIVVLSCLC